MEEWQKIAEGNTAEIFRIDHEKVAKLFKSGYSHGDGRCVSRANISLKSRLGRWCMRKSVRMSPGMAVGRGIMGNPTLIGRIVEGELSTLLKL